ncbi:MAG: ornithine--oxo-acid transaminase [Gemmatimonadota bacterium]|nr:ornithine--oxo-acid transaminase [Gemmatimonadota bacterium]MDH3366816.1 ornithine--oxo-acid transaminase [Gemmatimonadota bacterium]MDH3478673.1 ornithine--oxo-acid transaminase [Gemmatimonadota bacterium]MDH3569657.1 ornithine--oxo-acid transaminase [Gemmatimonadota bacterium]MDH5551092.1 ornithine--oxo-acid transaminase [Gemmatimonadota bacterium]
MKTTAQYLAEVDKYSAHNYHPLPIVLSRGEGAWVWDTEGNKYLDCLAAYSAVNQGHRHPKIVQAAKEQLDRLTLTSRAFHNDQMGPFVRELCELTGYEKALPMNSGAEAVETAIKAVRRWGYRVKGVPADRAEIIVCANNFHGRTTTIVSFSTEESYKADFGPLTPGFKIIPYGDSAALEKAITPNTVAFLVEPLQGEGGVIVPPDGFLGCAAEICKQNNVLFAADEIQTGLGRTGKMFCCDWEDVTPDVLIVGKALSGGFYPVSAMLANEEIMSVFHPGDHGSTFGGNPLGAAVARAALKVIVEERLPERAQKLGSWFMNELRSIDSPHVKEVRGRGLMIGVEIKRESGPARPFCEGLMERGILAKETHEQVVRFAPPLVVEQSDLEWALAQTAEVLAGAGVIGG